MSVWTQRTRVWLLDILWGGLLFAALASVSLLDRSVKPPEIDRASGQTSLLSTAPVSDPPVAAPSDHAANAPQQRVVAPQSTEDPLQSLQDKTPSVATSKHSIPSGRATDRVDSPPVFVPTTVLANRILSQPDLDKFGNP